MSYAISHQSIQKSKMKKVEKDRLFWWVDQTENTLWDYTESPQRTLWITSSLPQKCSAWKQSSKKYKEKTKMKDNYFLSLSFWLIFHPLWSSGLKCSSKLKMWHLYISRFSTIKRCGFNGFTAENQCFKVIPPATHIGGHIFNLCS